MESELMRHDVRRVVEQAEALLDIWDDAEKPHESRSYIDGAFKNAMDDLRSLVAALQVAAPPTPPVEPSGAEQDAAVYTELDKAIAKFPGGWRPCPRPFRLPDDAPFFVMNSNGFLAGATYVDEKGEASYWTPEEEYSMCSGVTHWMPAPSVGGGS